jgi:hypothetical protein
MLSGVLHSERAIMVNIAIMRAFVELRRWARAHETLARKLAALESKSDQRYLEVMRVLERLMALPGVSGASGAKRIGFPKGEIG